MRPAMQQHLRQTKGENLYCLYLVALCIQSTYVRSGFKMIEEIDELKNIKKRKKKKVSDRQQTSALAFKTCSDAFKNIYTGCVWSISHHSSCRWVVSLFSPTYTSKNRTTLPSATNAGVRVCLFFFLKPTKVMKMCNRSKSRYMSSPYIPALHARHKDEREFRDINQGSRSSSHSLEIYIFALSIF